MNNKENAVELPPELLKEYTSSKSDRPRNLLKFLQRLERAGIDVGSDYRLEHPFAQDARTVRGLTHTVKQRS